MTQRRRSLKSKFRFKAAAESATATAGGVVADIAGTPLQRRSLLPTFGCTVIIVIIAVVVIVTAVVWIVAVVIAAVVVIAAGVILIS